MEPAQDSDEEFNKTFIDDGSILDKYKAASEIADKALAHVVSLCVPGADIAETCEAGDLFIEEECKKVFAGKKAKKLERGIAFPTCICPNEITLNYSPLKDESRTIAEGDVLKIDLGAQIDGYFGHVGTTIIAGGAKAEGEKANLIAAGHTALQAAIRTTVEGNTNEDVTKVIAKVAEEFGVLPLEGAYSHKHKKHFIDETDVIMNKKMPEKPAAKYEFQKGDVFGLDVYMAIGEGKARLAEIRTTVFKRQLENTYILKTQAGRDFISEVGKRFPSLPFSIRAFENVTKAKLGVKHCIEHELLEPFEVHDVREGELVVSFKATVAICPSGTLVLCGDSHFNAENFPTDKKVEDEELSKLLELSMDLKEQKKRKKEAKKAAKEEEKKE
jgi:curved DNA binding protein